MALVEVEKIIRQLIEDGLEDSADKLCTLFLSSCPSSNPSSSSDNPYSKLFELQGDCAYTKEEYTRSLQLYRHAIHNEQNKFYYSINSKEIAQIHYKISQCYLKLNDKSAAIRELEIIPKDFRTTKINVTLAKLYYSSELKLSANSVLKQVVKSSPFALECMEMLVNLGVETREFLVKPKTGSSSQQPSEMHALCQDWISSIITSLSSHRLSQYQGRSIISTFSCL
jgi:tetratricopeptide (TPR) repeat protein